MEVIGSAVLHWSVVKVVYGMRTVRLICDAGLAVPTRSGLEGPPVCGAGTLVRGLLHR
jgi:hypothetical protein